MCVEMLMKKQHSVLQAGLTYIALLKRLKMCIHTPKISALQVKMLFLPRIGNPLLFLRLTLINVLVCLSLS
ncbi:hypothetical protein HanIR_Chr17g0849991 [Helianthus annuus]|nr:hypothetical protein HanIR_Chr17g0849991 [Helianthus annuus]